MKQKIEGQRNSRKVRHTYLKINNYDSYLKKNIKSIYTQLYSINYNLICKNFFIINSCLYYQAQFILEAIELKNTQLLSSDNILFTDRSTGKLIPLCS